MKLMLLYNYSYNIFKNKSKICSDYRLPRVCDGVKIDLNINLSINIAQKLPFNCSVK